MQYEGSERRDVDTQLGCQSSRGFGESNPGEGEIGTNQTEAKLKGGANGGLILTPSVFGFGRTVEVIDAQSRCDVDKDTSEEQGSDSPSLAERYLEFQHDEDGHESAQ